MNVKTLVWRNTYLPRTLGEAIVETEKSSFLRELLGNLLFEAYVSNRKSEWKLFREHVTDWEIYRFKDIL